MFKILFVTFASWSDFSFFQFLNYNLALLILLFAINIMKEKKSDAKT